MSENTKVLADRNDIVAIADAVRSKLDTTDEMTLGGIVAGINSIGGGSLPTLSSPANVDEVFEGQEFIDGNGTKKIGTFSLDAELNTQDNLISQIMTALDSKIMTEVAPSISVNASGLITATAGTKSSTYQLSFQPAKTITPTTTNQTAVSSGYYTGGVVTVKGDNNLVANNIKSGVSIFGVNGTYTGSGSSSGNTNIENAIITKTLTSYSNNRVTSIGNYVFYSCMSLTTVSFPACKSISEYAFQNCTKLTTVSFPACENIGKYAFCVCYALSSANFPACKSLDNNAFDHCSKLTTANFPACNNISSGAFKYCAALTTVSFPVCRSIGNNAFVNCSKLTTVSFPACINIGSSAFSSCSSLNTIYLMESSVCTLAHSNAFSRTEITSSKGSIYVPASLVASYKSKTNWTYFSKRIFSA